MAVKVFLDTSVLVAGLIDFGAQSAPAQSVMHAVAENQISGAATAWHCCLEFYSVSTRLPPEFRLSAADAATLLEEEIFGRLSIHDLPAGDRQPLIAASSRDGVAGGRIYDAHVAEVARAAGASVVVTDNRRHFVTALKHGLRVETPAEFMSTVKSRRG